MSNLESSPSMEDQKPKFDVSIYEKAMKQVNPMGVTPERMPALQEKIERMKQVRNSLSDLSSNIVDKTTGKLSQMPLSGRINGVGSLDQSFVVDKPIDNNKKKEQTADAIGQQGVDKFNQAQRDSVSVIPPRDTVADGTVKINKVTPQSPVESKPISDTPLNNTAQPTNVPYNFDKLAKSAEPIPVTADKPNESIRFTPEETELIKEIEKQGYKVSVEKTGSKMKSINVSKDGTTIKSDTTWGVKDTLEVILEDIKTSEEREKKAAKEKGEREAKRNESSSRLDVPGFENIKITPEEKNAIDSAKEEGITFTKMGRFALVIKIPGNESFSTSVDMRMGINHDQLMDGIKLAKDTLKSTTNK